MNNIFPLEYIAPLYLLAVVSFCALLAKNWKWLSPNKYLGHLALNFVGIVIAGIWIKPLSFGRWTTSVDTIGEMAERVTDMVYYGGGIAVLVALGLHQLKLWMDDPR